jgi:hypothetical protein
MCPWLVFSSFSFRFARRAKHLVAPLGQKTCQVKWTNVPAYTAAASVMKKKVYNSATFSPLEVVPDEAEDDSRPRLREVSEAEDMVELLSEFCLKM